jgi:hypothetical protein
MKEKNRDYMNRRRANEVYESNVEAHSNDKETMLIGVEDFVDDMNEQVNVAIDTNGRLRIW